MRGIRKWARTGDAQATPSSSGVDLEACNQIDTSSWPTAFEYSLEQRVADEFLQSLCTSNERLDIKVGKGKRARRWKVHKALICHYSEYFNGACRNPRTGFRESLSGIFDLAEDKPASFELFLNWLYSEDKQSKEFKFSETDNTEAWKLYAAETFILADKLIATEFSRFALGKVIQNAHLLDVYDMETIYEETLPTNALRRFAAGWVLWRCQRQPHLWDSSRNRKLQHDRTHRSRQIVSDPRGFQIEHWYSECAHSGAACPHAITATGSNPTTNSVLTESDLPRTWSKRDRHNRPAQLKAFLTAFVFAFGPALVKLSAVALLVGILVMTIVLSIRFAHCGHCGSGCHGCAPCHCGSCEHWCTHHAFLFCCDTTKCECCGGFPFCCFAWCCCHGGYDVDGCCGCSVLNPSAASVY